MSEPPRLNARGRGIWFVASSGADGGGTCRPVSREGRRAFAAAALWVLACGVGGMTAFAVTWNARCFLAMFVSAGAGLGLFARTVARHS